MIPESERTKNQREFVGSTFPTPKGGVLTVISYEGKKIGTNKIYVCSCSICSNDLELFPHGSITSKKSHLTSGVIPCGCAKSVSWKDWQYEIRVKRECNTRGYIFNGWFGEYRGSKTYLQLENPETGNKWNTTTIRSFLINKVGDPVSGRLTTTKDQNYYVDIFMLTGGYLKGTKFCRDPYKLENWNYTCPKCSNDEYVKVGICSGVFHAHVSNLKLGKKSCRCAKSYRWTQKQREYQINKICKEEDLTFLGWEDGYKLSKSKLKWSYSDDDFINTTFISDFFNGVRRNNHGFQENRPASLYITRWYSCNESYLKFGITNREVLIRTTEQFSNSKLDYEVLHEFNHDSGSVIANIEKECKKHLTTGVCPKKLLPDGYTETIEDIEDNLNKLLQIIKYNLS